MDMDISNTFLEKYWIIFPLRGSNICIYGFNQKTLDGFSLVLRVIS